MMHNLYKSSDWYVLHRLISTAGQIKHYEWDSTYRKWLETYKVYLKEIEDEYSRMLKLSNRALKAFGGDPSSTDWSNFRPLRLSREEDWADWLMHLIEQSGTGLLSSMYSTIVIEKLRHSFSLIRRTENLLTTVADIGQT